MHLDLFSSVALVAAAAGVLVWTMQKLGQSAIVAYLALGLVIGPSCLDVIRSDADVQHLAEFGVIFLLFFVGLDFHLSALKQMARLATLGALAQVGATTVVLGGAGVLCGFPLIESGILGFCAALSSTAIVLKAFDDRRESDTAVAETSVGILIGQDLVALLLLAAMPFLIGGGSDAGSDAGGLGPVARLGIMGVAVPALVIAARRLLPLAFRRAAMARNQEVFALCSLSACLLVAVAAQWAGASMALGAFLGGLAVADTPFAHQMRADLAVIKNLALGFFFVSVGMLVDLSFVAENWVLLALGLPVVLVGKAAITSVVLKLFRRPWSVAAGAGIALSQIGEFALVLPKVAKDADILAESRYQTLITLTVLTMMVAPVLVARSLAWGRRLATGFGRPEPHAPAEPPHAGDMPEPAEPAAPLAPAASAVVVGYGPVGRTVSRLLIRFGVEPCVIDLQIDTVKKLHAIGRGAVFGDAGRREILLAAGIAEARYLVMTLPDSGSRAAIIATARALNPDIVIVSRARYLSDRPALERAGVLEVGIEETEVAGELARLLLKRLDVACEMVDREVAAIRREIAVRTGFTRIMRSPFANVTPANPIPRTEAVPRPFLGDFGEKEAAADA